MATLPITIDDAHVNEILLDLLAYKPKPDDFTGTNIQWAVKVVRDNFAEAVLLGRLKRYREDRPLLADLDEIIT